MISFSAGSYRFQLRAAAVLLRDGAVLLHRAEGDAFWALPGGRVEPGETAADAAMREMKEELSLEIQAQRLVWLVENFYQYQGETQHEVGMYFLMEPPKGNPLATGAGPHLGNEGHRRLEFAWFDPRQLAHIEVRPSFLSRLLAAQDFSFQHVVHRDGSAHTLAPAEQKI